jgi:hypothetical protein
MEQRLDASNISIPSGIIKGRAMSCCSLGVQTPAATGMFNAASELGGLLRYYHQEAA